MKRNNWICHYGVKGMKWGVRRTPEQLGHERKARKMNSGAAPLKYKSPALAKTANLAKQTGLRTLAMIDPTGIAALAYNSWVVKSYVDIGKQYASSNEKWQKKDGPIEKLSQMKKKTAKGQTMEEDASYVNKGSKDGRTKNCLACVCALEMRQRGYDVQARRRAYGADVSKYHDWFDDVKIEGSASFRQKGESRKTWVDRNYSQLTNKLEAYPSGSRGFLAFTYEGSTSGHTISWEVKDKNVTFYDAQGKKTAADKVLSFSNQDYIFGRLDNCRVKDQIGEMVISRKGKG